MLPEKSWKHRRSISYPWSVGICRLPKVDADYSLFSDFYNAQAEPVQFSYLFILIIGPGRRYSASGHHGALLCSIWWCRTSATCVLTALSALLVTYKRLKPVSRTQVNRTLKFPRTSLDNQAPHHSKDYSKD